MVIILPALLFTRHIKKNNSKSKQIKEQIRNKSIAYILSWQSNLEKKKKKKSLFTMYAYVPRKCTCGKEVLWIQSFSVYEGKETDFMDKKSKQRNLKFSAFCKF